MSPWHACYLLQGFHADCHPGTSALTAIPLTGLDGIPINPKFRASHVRLGDHFLCLYIRHYELSKSKQWFKKKSDGP